MFSFCHHFTLFTPQFPPVYYLICSHFQCVSVAEEGLKTKMSNVKFFFLKLYYMYYVNAQQSNFNYYQSCLSLSCPDTITVNDNNYFFAIIFVTHSSSFLILNNSAFFHFLQDPYIKVPLLNTLSRKYLASQYLSSSIKEGEREKSIHHFSEREELLSNLL